MKKNNDFQIPFYEEDGYHPEELMPFSKVVELFPAFNEDELIDALNNHAILPLKIIKCLKHSDGGTVTCYCRDPLEGNYYPSYDEMQSLHLLKKDVDSLCEAIGSLREYSEVEHSELEGNKDEAISRLSEENRQLRRQLQTRNASIKKAKDETECWKAYLETAVKITVHCAQTTQKLKNSDYEKFHKDKSFGEITGDVITTLRSILPPDFKKGPGRPKKTKA